MKKLLFLVKASFVACLVLLSQFAFAQKVTVSGVIKSPDGILLRAAIIKDVAGGKVKTDSAGFFKLAVNIPAKLQVSCVGYRDTTVNVTAAIQLDITLRIGVNIADTKDHTTADPLKSINVAPLKTAMETMGINDLNPVSHRPIIVAVRGGAISVQNGTDFDAAAGAILPVFNPKEETKGSRYFYKNWVHGVVINNQGQISSGENYVLSYDKMGGGLIATKDLTSAIEVDRDKVSYFIMVSDKGDTVTFANVPQIDKDHYVQLLSSGSKYKIYKTIKTSFIKSNFTTNGLSTTGNNYDEYVDESSYYVLNLQTNQLQKFTLKKKVIKEVFANDGDKCSKFISDHSSDDIDDMYLSSLGSTLNK